MTPKERTKEHNKESQKEKGNRKSINANRNRETKIREKGRVSTQDKVKTPRLEMVCQTERNTDKRNITIQECMLERKLFQERVI